MARGTEANMRKKPKTGEGGATRGGKANQDATWAEPNTKLGETVRTTNDTDERGGNKNWILPDRMENCNSHSYSQTREGPDSGGKFPPDRAPLYSRQSSRENYIKQIVPPCGTKQYLNPGTAWIPT
ncbi:hypothetical protein TNCV_5004281 [Trichonephila clavipes]|nr:hypothetical protein TNCV_5004281 [Trichonephila clavipes]